MCVCAKSENIEWNSQRAAVKTSPNNGNWKKIIAWVTKNKGKWMKHGKRRYNTTHITPSHPCAPYTHTHTLAKWINIWIESTPKIFLKPNDPNMQTHSLWWKVLRKPKMIVEKRLCGWIESSGFKWYLTHGKAFTIGHCTHNRHFSAV